MKPVEIEFLMKDNLSKGVDKSVLAVELLAEKAEEASSLIRSRIAEQRKSIEGLTRDLQRMEAQLSGMKPGPAQQNLATDIAACRKVLDEERSSLERLEREHLEAEERVRSLREEYVRLSSEEGAASDGSKSLTERLRAQKEVVAQVERDVRGLEKAYEKAAPGNSKSAALSELKAAKRALEEEQGALAGLRREQEEARQSGKRLSMQLRELQDGMARMRLAGQQDSEAYREMARRAAELSDTLSDLNAQTRILSHDDANLQGFMSGVSGLSGLFTSATGALSLFASENENLARIQTRVQSVMAVTMGLQQVMNTLNKDSAFRLVTVVKLKNLLTAANSRLAVSLGISTAAAKALMATLTLGLSAVVAGLIAAWDRYSASQERAASKARELVEIESSGRAEMIKTRFELDSALASLKAFTGGKDEEKKKVEELNRKYGESFGYYGSVAEWYDTLRKKGSDYIQTLFLQAEAQALVQKAVEADARLNEIKATAPGDVEGSMGALGKLSLYSAQSATYGRIDARAEIAAYNKAAKERAVAEAQAEVDAYLRRAEELTKEAARIRTERDLGGHTAPGTKASVASELQSEQQRASELLKLQTRNRQREIDLLKESGEKRIRQIRLNYDKELAELAAQEEKWRSAQAGRLTAEQESSLREAREQAASARDADLAKVTADENEAARASMLAYLKEYGTFQQQKLAIAEEYADKIEKAQNEGERLSLERARDTALQKAETEAIKQTIDWGSVFGEFGAMFRDQLQPTLDKLRELSKSDEFRSGSLEEQRLLYELIAKLEQSGSAWDGDIFRRVSEDLSSYQSALRSYMAAQEREREATEALSAAKRKLAEYESSGDYENALAAQAAVTEAETALENASEGVRLFGGEVEDATIQLQSSAERARSMFSELESGLSGLASGSLKGIGQGLMRLDKLFNNSEVTGKVGDALAKGFQSLFGEESKASQAVSEALGNAGMAGQIISAILGILDVIAKEGVSGLLTGLQDTVFGAIEKIQEEIFNGDIIMKPVENVLGHMGNILNNLTFGGFDKWTGAGGNAKEVMENIERLTDRNESLQEAIEDLTEEIKAGRGTQSVAAYREAYKYQKETIENYKRIAQEQARYSGSHHSWNYYWGGFSREETARLSEKIGRKWNGDLWDLSPDEMKTLRSTVDLWEKIRDTGKGGYGDRLAEKLDDYIEQAGSLEELTNSLYEGLTGISFDGMYSSFIENLMDMKYGAEEAAEDISEYFTRAMLSNKIGELYADKLEEWWKKFGASMEDNELTEAERNSLQNEYTRYVDEAMKLRDQIFAATGYGAGEEAAEAATSAGQRAKAGGFAAMTQDQGTKLEGLFTSGLEHWSSIDARLENVSDKMNSAEGHLARIAEHTGASAGHLSEIKEDIKKIVRDGLKVK